MSYRVTRQMVQRSADVLAKTMGLHPAKHYNDVNGLCLSEAYGGIALELITSPDGAVEQIGSTGHVSKKELYNMIHFAISVLRLKEQIEKQENNNVG